MAITPGRDFGDRDAEKYVRFTYTVPIEQLQEVVARAIGRLHFFQRPFAEHFAFA